MQFRSNLSAVLVQFQCNFKFKQNLIFEQFSRKKCNFGAVSEQLSRKVQFRSNSSAVSNFFLFQFTGKMDREYIGFASLPDQIHRKTIKKGFEFTLMVAGETGLGKSTLVNTLFLTDLYQDRIVPPVHG